MSQYYCVPGDLDDGYQFEGSIVVQVGLGPCIPDEIRNTRLVIVHQGVGQSGALVVHQLDLLVCSKSADRAGTLALVALARRRQVLLIYIGTRASCCRFLLK